MSNIDVKTTLVDNKVNIILLFGISIFSIGTYTLETFLSSPTIKVVYLLAAIIMFIFFYMFYNEGIHLYKVEPLFFLFVVYFLTNLLLQGFYNKIHIIDLLVFISIILILILFKINVRYFLFS